MMHAKALDALREGTAHIESGLLPLATYPVRLPQLLDCMTRCHVPGASIAVIADYRLEWAGGYGVCEVGQSELVTPDTLFQACSVSKPVTAIAALRLVQEGILDLDEDLNSSLVSWKVPTNRTGQPQVTLRHLLSHTAGLTLCWYLGFRRGTKMPTLLHVLNGEPPAQTRAVRVQIPPGTRFRYSESHFALLQQLLTDVTSIPFPDLMHTLVFEPKGQGETARFRHSGDNIGFKCFVQGFCEGGMGAVLMSNGDNGEVMQKELFQIIAKEYGWSTSSARGVHARPKWREMPHRLALGTLRKYVRIVRFGSCSLRSRLMNAWVAASRAQSHLKRLSLVQMLQV